MERNKRKITTGIIAVISIFIILLVFLTISFYRDYLNTSNNYKKLNEELEVLGANTFEDCVSLEHITIPSNVKTIGADAFLNCPLKTMKIKAITPPTLYDPAINPNIEAIYVPQGTLSAYQTEWSDFANKFIEYYDKVISKPIAKFNISVGLFKIRPDVFINLDRTNIHIYISRNTVYFSFISVLPNMIFSCVSAFFSIMGNPDSIA